jgi:hypothetical protein
MRRLTKRVCDASAQQSRSRRLKSLGNFIHGVRRLERRHRMRTCASISPSTRVHARVTSLRQIRSVCGAFVVAVARPSPHFPALTQDGKEGFDGSFILSLDRLDFEVEAEGWGDETLGATAWRLARQPHD